jgi:hypothetical protein
MIESPPQPMRAISSRTRKDEGPAGAGVAALASRRGALRGFVGCKPLLNKIEWTERTCVVKRGCVFSTILWVIIIVVALLALGFFARGRRR